MHDKMVSVGVALGSNLPSGIGNSTETLNNAVERIRVADVTDVRVSRFFQTPAWPPGSGPDFVNAALALRTDLGPRDVLDLLHGIEADLGRVRRERWGPRAIDLDLLFYGKSVLPDMATYKDWLDLAAQQQQQVAPDQMILPHPRMQDRGFVLVPLGDVASDWTHPVLHQTVAQMIAALPPSAIEGVEPLQTRC